MPTFARKLKVVLFAVLAACLISCGSSASRDSSDSGSGSGSEDTPTVTPTAASQCGFVIDGQVVNPLPEGQGFLVDVDVIRPDLVVVRFVDGINAGGEALVQLHGITADGIIEFLLQQGTRALESLTSQGAYFIPAGQTIDCSVTVIGGGTGQLGQLVTLDGQNINEIMVQIGAALPQNNGCGGELISGCYSSLDVTETFSSLVIREFLWKPVSERDGNVVVLVNPRNVRVVVNGQTFVDFGPSNGRGTTARGTRPGCGYGGNVRVEFFDDDGLRIRTADGRTSVTVPNGCDRLDTRF